MALSSPTETIFVVQVRLMLVLAPAACCLAGVAVHEALKVLMHAVWLADEKAAATDSVEATPTKSPVGKKGRPTSAVKVSSRSLS